MESITGDVQNLDHLKSVIDTHQPELIFHMAAQSLVRFSYSNPVETFATNIMGTVNLLEAARHSKSVKVIINITSDKCYENREQALGYKESDPMGGYDPYSSSKACSELVTSAYRNSFFNPNFLNQPGVSLASVRAGNVIGGGDWATDRLIPDMMRAIFENRPAMIRNPNAIRPWQHVLEPLNGYLILAEKLWKNGPKYSEAWNFGPSDEDCKPVLWLVSHLKELWGNGMTCQVGNHQNDHEATHLKLNISKVKKRLGWSPKLSLATALQLTVDWYKGYRENKNMRQLTEIQISQF